MVHSVIWYHNIWYIRITYIREIVSLYHCVLERSRVSRFWLGNGPLQQRLRSGPRAGGLSWKVRYRTFLWFFSQMIKLYMVRSLLYRRQILQENIRWKALGEIYKIYIFLHRSEFQPKIVNIFSRMNNEFSICFEFLWNFGNEKWEHVKMFSLAY